jgi:histidinol-phosphate aminotransferase
MTVQAIAAERTASVHRYRGGREAGRPAGKLSSNEAPLGPSPRARAAIAGAAAVAHRYAGAAELRALIADREGVPPEQVVLTSGSDELCYLLATVFIPSGAPVVLSDPCYRIDELVTRLHHGAAHFVPLRDGAHDLDAMAAAAERAAVVWLPSPHNPTGRAVDPAALAHFLAAVPPECLVVLDEAYHHYVDADLRPDAHALVTAYPNLVVQRTFSKAYALAGLRIGYGMGDPEVIAALDAIRPPFNINAAALAGARAALTDVAWRDYTVELVVRERRRLETLLASLELEFHPSQANFVAVRPPRPAELHAALAREGIVIRDGADLGHDGWVRISIGAPPQMAVLRAVLTRHLERA